jgi:hypothetical protein
MDIRLRGQKRDAGSIARSLWSASEEAQLKTGPHVRKNRRRNRGGADQILIEAIFVEGEVNQSVAVIDLDVQHSQHGKTGRA